MIAKRLLSETEEEYETSEGRRITIGVPSNCKNMIQKLIDDYAGASTITATVLELGETNKDILNRLIYLSDYDELPDLILAADAVIVQIVEYNLSAFVNLKNMVIFPNIKILNWEIYISRIIRYTAFPLMECLWHFIITRTC